MKTNEMICAKNTKIRLGRKSKFNIKGCVKRVKTFNFFPHPVTPPELSQLGDGRVPGGLRIPEPLGQPLESLEDDVLVVAADALLVTQRDLYLGQEVARTRGPRLGIWKPDKLR